MILACEQGRARIVLLDASQSWGQGSAVVWAWSATADSAIEVGHRGWFNNPSEAKAVLGGTYVLTTASGGGVALIRVRDARAVFYAHIGGNPHSAALLPGGWIAVASSTGDRVTLLQVSNTSPESPTTMAYTLSDVHGLVWDRARRSLWVLGGKQMVRIVDRSTDEKAVYEWGASWIDLPDTPEARTYPRHGGHDLSVIPGEDALFVTDMDHLWRFNPEAETFTSLPTTHHLPLVKSISQRGPGGPTIVMQATEQWWADTVRTIDADSEQVWTLPGARFYKARWWVTNHFDRVDDDPVWRRWLAGDMVVE